jgi:1-pyrroline-5-carboxylate dehydrogenase
MGGNYDKSKGYFIEPTVILTTNPKYTTMETELFGPVVTIYVYEDAKWAETLELVDTTSEYALTGAEPRSLCYRRSNSKTAKCCW